VQQLVQQAPRSAAPGPDAVPDPGALPTGMSVTFLGTSSGAPTLERNVSCMLVRTHHATYMVDCGEGTHRQLGAANADPASIEGIFITHLHGDHCFGLPGVILSIDDAKAAAATAAAATPAVKEQRSKGKATSTRQASARTTLSSTPSGAPAQVPHTYVYGPPGLAEMLRVSLALPGAAQHLKTRFTVTELVVAAEDAHPPRPMSGQSEAVAGTASAEQPGIMVQRLAASSLDDVPRLKAASQRLHVRLQAVPVLWRPPMRLGSYQSHARGQNSDDVESFGGRNYVAAEGLFWELPVSHMRVRAAQLQHRVPCWGYVLEEYPQREQGIEEGASTTGSSDESPDQAGQRPPRGRKVVLLGDTINSNPIAPLAIGCDLLSHEATFMAGMEDKCRVAQHSTGYLAGAFAAAVGARHLVLTHFSARYNRFGPSVTGSMDQGLRGRPNGTWRERPYTAEQEAADQNQAIRALMSEARQTYSRGVLTAASDFYTVHVPKLIQRSATSTPG